MWWEHMLLINRKILESKNYLIHHAIPSIFSLYSGDFVLLKEILGNL